MSNLIEETDEEALAKAIVDLRNIRRGRHAVEVETQDGDKLKFNQPNAEKLEAEISRLRAKIAGKDRPHQPVRFYL